MVFKIFSSPSFFALNIAVRALLVAVLAFAVFYLLVTTHYYATALVIAGLMLMTVFDLARILNELGEPMTRVLEALSMRVHEIPLGSTERFVPGYGAVGKTISLLQDERKEHARQMAYLQSLIDTVATSLMVISPDGRIQLANRAAQMLAGEMVGRLSDVSAIGADTAAALLSLQPGGRGIVRLANGQQMLASMTEFAAPGTEDLRLLGLQSIVGELDAVELKAWRDMTRVLAHEMMNSLTPISSLAESLPGLLNIKSDDAVAAAETINRRALGLLNFVERYRKIADLPEPVLKPLALSAFLKDIDTLMTPMLAQKHIAYSSSVTPATLTLEADAELLSQAVINLLKNATDAMEGPGFISLSCSQNEGRVLIAVADTGAGISPDRLDDIFVPFFTTKTGGAGIGLSLARQIALAHRGQIEVEANVPRGTIFRITLPGNN